MNIHQVGPTPKAKRYELIRSKLKGNVTLKDVLSTSRRADVVAVRFEVWYVMNTEWKMSTVHIGELWGMDHTSVLNGLKRHREKLNGPDQERNDQTGNQERRSSSNF